MYKEMYEEAVKLDRTVYLSLPIKIWGEPGDTIVGRLLKFKPFRDANGAKANQYILETDDDIVSVVLGQYTDQQIESEISHNDVIAITYKGRICLGDGYKFNCFDVVILPKPPTPTTRR